MIFFFLLFHHSRILIDLLSWLKVVPAARKREQRGHAYFHSHPVGQNLVTWPHLAAEEAEKCVPRLKSRVFIMLIVS